MKSEVVVSIVVAIYKSEKFLVKLLDSIQNQTYKNIEVILVDDGSPDNSGEICDDYEKKDKRFHVIHQHNSGTCAARNVGIDKATGEFLLIVDGDDWLEIDYVEYLLKLALSTDSDMAMSDKLFTTLDRKQTVDDCTEVWSNEKASIAIIYPTMLIGPWNKLYKMEMINRNHLRFSVPWSGEGLYFACMAAQYSNQVCVGHRKVYNYRLNNMNSGLTNYNLQIATNALDNIKHIRNVSVIRTEKMMNAIDWHIWKNHYFVMYLIVATHSKNKEKHLYNECKHYIRKNLIKVLLKSDIPCKEKIKMIISCIIPKIYAEIQLNRKRKRLKNDRME